MHRRSKPAAATRPILWSAFIAVNISTIIVMTLFWAAALGNESAANGLLMITLPQFNLASAMLPADLQSVPLSLQMVLASAILQIAIVLTVVIAGAWLLLRRSAPAKAL